MFDYVILPTCTFAEFAALPVVATTPVQDGGYMRARLSEAVPETANVIVAPEVYVISEGDPPVLLGTFI